MIRLLLLTLICMPPASLPVAASPSIAIEATSASASAERHCPDAGPCEDAADPASNLTPMQEEIVADHHPHLSPFRSSLWEKHVLAPAAPLFPVVLVDLFRPPKRA